MQRKKRPMAFVLTLAVVLSFAVGQPQAAAESWLKRRVLKPLKGKLTKARQEGDLWVGTTLRPRWGSVHGQYLMDANLKRLSDNYPGVFMVGTQPVAIPHQDQGEGRILLDRTSGKKLQTVRNVWRLGEATIIEALPKGHKKNSPGSQIWDEKRQKAGGKRYRWIAKVNGKLLGINSEALSTEIVSASRAKPEDFVPVLDPRTGLETRTVPLRNSARGLERTARSRRKKAIKKGLNPEQAHKIVADYARVYLQEHAPLLTQFQRFELTPVSGTEYRLRFTRRPKAQRRRGRGDREPPPFAGEVGLSLSDEGNWYLSKGQINHQEIEL